MILAVLERSARISLSDRDVFVNVTGGLSLKDPASDLAVAAALVSSVSDRPLPDDAVLFGEIGLTGELRDVPQVELRLKEAARMGFRQAILPAVSTGGSPPSDIHCVHCERIGDALKTLRPAVVDQIG